jgi:hypothetical protein
MGVYVLCHCEDNGIVVDVEWWEGQRTRQTQTPHMSESVFDKRPRKGIIVFLFELSQAPTHTRWAAVQIW